MASIGRWRRADPGSVPDLGLRPGLVRISRSKAGRRISDRIGWTAAASADPRTRPTRGDDAFSSILRPVPPNVSYHSAWYFRSRRHSISVGMPLQASQNISAMIGVDATSKSVRATAWTIRPLRHPVVDPNRSIREPSCLRQTCSCRGAPQTRLRRNKAPWPASISRVVRPGRRRRLRVGC